MGNPVARILVADDEAAIRQSVGNILRYADYEVEEDIPQGNWTYAVQVFSTSGLACTIAE